ncbi:MAG: energy transducer TonB [Sphingomicrobium sp.]|nr:energy transducer TonB [Sphingomonadales bacterium]
MLILLVSLQLSTPPPSKPLASISPTVRHHDRFPRRARAKAPLVSLFSSDDYPGVALRKWQQGRVLARMTIGRTGRITNCTILASSKSPSLDAATCRIFAERAVFDPARDRHGRAVPDHDSQSVIWRIPEDAPIEAEVSPVPLINSRSSVTYVVRDGKPGACTISSADAPPALVRDACGELEGVARLARAALGSAAVEPYRLRVTTIMSIDDVPPALEGLPSFRQSAKLTVDPTGFVLSCQAVSGSDAPFAVAALCARAREVRFDAIPLIAAEPSPRQALITQSVEQLDGAGTGVEPLRK